MPRYALRVMYDGTAFSGSQIQGTQPTVQLALNCALATLLRHPIETFGASRTDEGVHALGNVYHFDMDAALSTDDVYRLNAILPNAVSVTGLFSVAPDFNARFAATSRRYRYRIYRKKNPFLFHRALHYPYRIERSVLDETAAVLMEYTDFEAFSKRGAQVKTYRCAILQSFWEQQGEELHYVVEANRFLRGMVRGLVGTQLRAGRGKYDVAGFRKIIESKDCREADFSPKGWGLYLEEVIYPTDLLIPLS